GAGAAMPMCGAVPGMVPRDGDCDDSDPGITPGATELCDDVDNDCDANTDEGASASCSGANAIYSCVDGFCEVAQCTGSYGDCDLRASTGCETDLAVTGGTAHCGYCNASCAGCMGGICSTGGVSSFGTLNSASGTALAGMPIYMPGTAPLRSTTSDAM
ncbi:MAG: hypothetical protein GWO04_28640, partial [Actinobacteria bacterium]|nr:hypothetical protein [Actinomycetota bacterium]NIS33680.1 hypothetical protein [Actinomycetota bacterium]NIV88691.1 hypothetical protein [Actinomycetota bacterium]